MQKLFARIAVEIADSAAEKQHENVVAVAASRCNGAQTLKVGLLESNDADQIHLRQLFFTEKRYSLCLGRRMMWMARMRLW